MIREQNNIDILFTGFLMLTLFACNEQTKKTTDKLVKVEMSDSLIHGYNELANPDGREIFTISDFNSDNPNIKNINRPEISVVSTNLDTSLLFDIWTNDPNAPNASFQFTSKTFSVTDYDGNGDMPYELSGNNLKVYYNDFIQDGEIISVKNDTLKIHWKGFEENTNYVRWSN